MSDLGVRKTNGIRLGFVLDFFPMGPDLPQADLVDYTLIRRHSIDLRENRASKIIQNAICFRVLRSFGIFLRICRLRELLDTVRKTFFGEKHEIFRIRARSAHKFSRKSFWSYIFY